MDVLVVVGDGEPPEWLALRSGHVMRAAPGDLDPEMVAHIRTHIPRRVGVYSATDAHVANDTAGRLRQHGFPVQVVADDAGAPMEAAQSLLALVGNTPLVRLDKMARSLSCHLLAKLEFMNPGGSVKDRPAVAMVEAAERDGRLLPGGTIVEPTSGNTGVGLAIVAARRGYRCVFVMPDKMSAEKIALLRAYGAEVVVCPTAVPPEHPESYYSVSDRLASEIPGGFKPDQYHNPANPASHVATTGPEIWRQTAGRITHFVAGIGTGGTISGVGTSLKSFNPDVQIVGADPEGSVYSGGSGRPYLVEGIGEDFWPTTYDQSVVDRVVMVSDRDSFLTARAVTREEGILVGGSAGTAVWAALHIGADLGPEAVVVVLIPDSGRGYLSKLYNDAWMADFGFLRAVGPTIADVLNRKSGELPPLVHVHPDELCRDVIALFREYEVSQVPVVKAEPPLVAAEVIGSISERDLLERAFADTSVLDRPVGDVMGAALPTVGSGESVDAAVEALEGAWAVLVLDSGHPVGIITRSDLLDFLARSRP